MLENKKSENKEWYYILAIAFSYTVAIFGGAFASGREIMQFYGRFGSMGFWGIWVSLALFAYFGLIGLDLARRWKCFDYKTYVVKLYEQFLPKPAASLGFWVFEIAYLFLCILILGIITATGASLIVEEWGIPYALAIFIMAGVIFLVVGFGAEVIRAFNFTITWILLLAALIILAIAFKPISGDSWQVITSRVGPEGFEWFQSAILYVAYNLIGVVMIASLAEPLTTRFASVTAGVLGGVGIGLLVMFEYLLAMAYYPEIVDEVLPLWFVCSKVGSSAVRVAYDFILIGAILTTGIAVTFPPVKRFKLLLVEKYGAEKENLFGFITTLVLILIGLALSTFGLIPLVAKGFTMMAWIFMVVFLIPLLIFGTKVAFSGRDN